MDSVASGRTPPRTRAEIRQAERAAQRRFTRTAPKTTAPRARQKTGRATFRPAAQVAAVIAMAAVGAGFVQAEDERAQTEAADLAASLLAQRSADRADRTLSQGAREAAQTARTEAVAAERSDQARQALQAAETKLTASDGKVADNATRQQLADLITTTRQLIDAGAPQALWQSQLEVLPVHEQAVAESESVWTAAEAERVKRAASARAAAVSGGAGTPAGYSDSQNGRLDPSTLCPIRSGILVQCNAAAAFARMDEAFRAAFGQQISVGNGYRSYSQQAAMRGGANASLVAPAGKSNHGWGLAIDLGQGGIYGYGGAGYKWLRENGPSYGWVNPSWAWQGNGREEPWHWEYVG